MRSSSFTRRRCGTKEGYEAKRSSGGVMDWGSPTSVHETRLLRLLPLLLVLVMAGRCEGCKVEQCTREYTMLQDEHGIEASERSLESCRLLHHYQKCIRSIAKSCRGDLSYHTAYSLLNHVINEYDCMAIMQQGSTASPALPNLTVPTVAEGHTLAPSSTVIPTRKHSRVACPFHGRKKFRHCGLFGDPHLKTFDNEYQTCRVRGAWPLIDNPYLAVQVTNEPVVEGSPATATTKVTIIIRGHNRTCASEKVYEAQSSDGPLPTVFIDGTRRSGPEENVVLTAHDDGTRVEIYVRYIEALLIVRQAGRYLAFSAQLPEDVIYQRVFPSRSNELVGEGLQLCVRGCPTSERLDPISARGHALPWEIALDRCKRGLVTSTDAVNNEVSTTNLTDHYLDWCVFDVMTTGEGEVADEFLAAAHSAQADVLRLDPSSLHKRGDPIYGPGIESRSSSSPSWTLTHSAVWLTLIILLRFCT